MIEEISYLESRSISLAFEKAKIWENAWKEWELVTFIDVVISKIKKAMRAYDLIMTILPEKLFEEEEQKIQDFEDSLVEALNYAKELKKRLK